MLSLKNKSELKFQNLNKIFVHDYMVMWDIKNGDVFWTSPKNFKLQKSSCHSLEKDAPLNDIKTVLLK